MRGTLFVTACLLLLAAIGAPAAPADNGGFTPVAPESPNADGIRDTFLFVSIFIVAVFVVVEVLLVAFVLKYRRRARDRFEDGAPIHGSTRLELLWTAAPAVALVAIAAFVFVELPGITDVPRAEARDDVLEVRVEGRQFYWQFEYPNGVIAIDTLRAPAGVPVRLEVTAPASDVIHSWWIPALGGKIDAIPGEVNETWFEANRPGRYEGQCTELCGIAHAQMLATAEIMEQGAFEAWLAERSEQQSAGTSDLGEESWAGVCAKCHGLAGEGGIGPRLAGSVLLSDPEAIERIARNGVRTMPAVADGWSEEHMRALTDYLEENPPSGQ